MIDSKLLKAKSQRLLQEFEDVLVLVVKTEVEDLDKMSRKGENEFEVVTRAYETEGIKKGLNRFMQRLNQWASKEQ